MSIRIPIAALLAAAALGVSAQPTAVPPAGAAPTKALSAAGPTLAQLLDAAWMLSQQDRVAGARADLLDARGLAARSAFAGPPSVGLDLRRDLPRWAGLPGTDPVAERGRNEIEPGVSVPIWLPGQRDAQQRVLQREQAGLSAERRARRLALAGAVREAAWALWFARSEEALQQARLRAAAVLEQDVARRVDAGELAPADRLLAGADRLAAQAAVQEAQSRTMAAASRLRELTGTDAAGDPLEPRPAAGSANGPGGDHPELIAARDAIDVARAQLELARATRRDNPTLSAVARFDRDAYGAGYRNSLRVGIEIPLDTEARNAPRLAAASLALAQAEVEYAQRRRTIDAGLERSRLALEAAAATLDVQAQRAAIAGEALAAFERAFRAGEKGLPELLRLRAQAFEARFAHAQAKAQHGLAVSRHHQALGLEPR